MVEISAQLAFCSSRILRLRAALGKETFHINREIRDLLSPYEPVDPEICK